MNRLHLLTIITIILCSTVGYLLGREDGFHERHVIIVEKPCECTTDADCYEKYGCGGYADPCEE